MVLIVILTMLVETCQKISISNMKGGGKVAICGSISTYGPCNKSRYKELDASNIKVKSFGSNQWRWAQQKQALDQCGYCIKQFWQTKQYVQWIRRITKCFNIYVEW